MLFLACETSFVDSANLDLFLNSHSVLKIEFKMCFFLFCMLCAKN